MALPESLVAAILLETEQGKMIQAERDELKKATESYKTLVADLKAQVDAGTATQAELMAKIDELESNAIDLEELQRRIADINPTPVADAVVTEVIENPEIEVPPSVEAAPEVAVDVVQDSAVVSDALDSLNEFMESEES